MDDNIFDIDLDFLLSTPPPQPLQGAPRAVKPSTPITLTSQHALQNSQETHRKQVGSRKQSLAERITNCDILIQQIKQMEHECTQLRQQLHDFQQSAKNIQELYESEKQQRNELQKKVAQSEENCERLDAELAHKVLLHDQLQGQVDAAKGPLSYSELAIKYLNLAQKLKDENKVLHWQEQSVVDEISKYCQEKNIRMPKSPQKKSPRRRGGKKVERVDKASQCEIPPPAAALSETRDQGTQITPLVATRSQGTQHISTTTTRSTTTACFIKQHHVGTIFPEPKPHPSIEVMLQELTKWSDISPLSPISEPTEDAIPVRTLTTSVGTCTFLCNVRRQIDFVAQVPTIKRSDSRPPSSLMFDGIKHETRTPSHTPPLPSPYNNLNAARTFSHSSLSQLEPSAFEELWQVFGHMLLGLLQPHRGLATALNQQDFHHWMRSLYDNMQQQHQQGGEQQQTETLHQRFPSRSTSPDISEIMRPQARRDTTVATDQQCVLPQEDHIAMSAGQQKEKDGACHEVSRLCPPPMNLITSVPSAFIAQHTEKTSCKTAAGISDEILKLFPGNSNNTANRKAIENLLKSNFKKRAHRKRKKNAAVLNTEGQKNKCVSGVNLIEKRKFINGSVEPTEIITCAQINELVNNSEQPESYVLKETSERATDDQSKKTDVIAQDEVADAEQLNNVPHECHELNLISSNEELSLETGDKDAVNSKQLDWNREAGAESDSQDSSIATSEFEIQSKKQEKPTTNPFVGSTSGEHENEMEEFQNGARTELSYSGISNTFVQRRSNEEKNHTNTAPEGLEVANKEGACLSDSDSDTDASILDSTPTSPVAAIEVRKTKELNYRADIQHDLFGSDISSDDEQYPKMSCKTTSRLEGINETSDMLNSSPKASFTVENSVIPAQNKAAEVIGAAIPEAINIKSDARAEEECGYVSKVLKIKGNVADHHVEKLIDSNSSESELVIDFDTTEDLNGISVSPHHSFEYKSAESGNEETANKACCNKSVNLAGWLQNENSKANDIPSSTPKQRGRKRKHETMPTNFPCKRSERIRAQRKCIEAKSCGASSEHVGDNVGATNKLDGAGMPMVSKIICDKLPNTSDKIQDEQEGTKTTSVTCTFTELHQPDSYFESDQAAQHMVQDAGWKTTNNSDLGENAAYTVRNSTYEPAPTSQYNSQIMWPESYPSIYNSYRSIHAETSQTTGNASIAMAPIHDSAYSSKSSLTINTEVINSRHLTHEMNVSFYCPKSTETKVPMPVAENKRNYYESNTVNSIFGLEAPATICNNSIESASSSCHSLLSKPNGPMAIENREYFEVPPEISYNPPPSTSSSCHSALPISSQTSSVSQLALADDDAPTLYDSPASPPPSFKCTTLTFPKEIPHTLNFTHHSKNKQTIWHSLIENYSTDNYQIINNKYPQKEAAKHQTLMAQLQAEIKNYLDSFEDAGENTNQHDVAAAQLIQRLQSLTKNVADITSAIVEQLSLAPSQQILCEIDEMPVKYATTALRDISYVMRHLQYTRPQFTAVLLAKIESRLFDYRSAAKVSLDAAINLTQLYLLAISNQITSIPENPARLFIAKCLYYHNQKAIPMIYEVICRFPTVLPHREEHAYDRSDPLITVIQHLLMCTSYDMNVIELRGKQLLSRLRFTYHFEPFRPDFGEVLTNLVEKLKAGKLFQLKYAFSIFCKRQQPQKIVENVLHAHLIPMLNEYYPRLFETPSYDARVAALLDCISTVVKPFPIEIDISSYHALFSRFLYAIERPVVQEAAVLAILRLQRFGYVSCFNSLLNFRPLYDLQPHTKAVLKTFIHRQPSIFWRKLQAQTATLRD